MTNSLDFSDSDLYQKIIAKKCKFIITGANGWLGKALLEILYFCFKGDLSKNVIALSSSQSKIVLRDGHEIDAFDYDHKFDSDQNYVLCHFAFLTKDKISLMNDDEYKKQNQIIRDNVAKIILQTKPISILYSSSGAIYGKGDLYGILKLEDEIYFQKLAEQINSQIIIPRIFNIAGPYINKYNLYALSDFIVQLVKNDKITINANFPVIRSYIHVADLFKIYFSLMLDDQNAEKSLIFDTANNEEVELLDLAKMVVDLISPNGKITREGYDKKLASNRYVGNIEIQRILCKRYNLTLADYKKIILDTFHYLKNLPINEK